MKGKRYKKKIKQRDGTYKKEKGWSRDPVKILPKDKRRAREIDQNIRIIYQALYEAEIDLDIDLDGVSSLNRRLSSDSDKYVYPIDFTNKFPYRTFHDQTIDIHGRFYGPWYMGIPKEYRKRILINGMPVVRLDFRAFHPSICYCLANEPIPENDPYTLPGYPEEKKGPYRKLFKLILLRMLNNKTDQGTVTSVIDQWDEDQEKAEKYGKPIPQPPEPLTDETILKFIGMLRDRHNPIEEFFDRGVVGQMLLTKDSQLMEKILLHFAQKGIAVLPVHDELVVGVDHAEEALEVMCNEFEKMFGQPIPIDGSVIEAIKDAMGRTQVLDPSPEWEEMESEITYQVKTDFNVK